MNSLLRVELSQWLLRYRERKVSLAEFHDWFVAATWSLSELAPALLVEAVHEIELRLAEFTNGHWSEEELRQWLTLLETPLSKMGVKD